MPLGPHARFESVYGFQINHHSYSVGVMDGEIMYWCSRSAEYYSQKEMGEIYAGTKPHKLPKQYKRFLMKTRKEQRDAKSKSIQGTHIREVRRGTD